MPAQRQIHGAGVLVPPAARVLRFYDEQLYIATLGGKSVFHATIKVINFFLLVIESTCMIHDTISKSNKGFDEILRLF